MQLAVHLKSTRPPATSIGRPRNLSRSGALVSGCDLQLFSLIHIVLQDETIAAYVTRLGDDGAGVEWCEFAPPAVAELLQTPATTSDPPVEPLVNYSH